MKFNFTQFVKELHAEHKGSLSLSEVKDILKLQEEYSRDSPKSTGKRLIINHLRFYGEKTAEEGQEYSEEKISYSQRIETGLNIWVADNLKGKSSIFKIVKYLLTGSNKIKKNIARWIEHALLNFNISDELFTIYINFSGSFVGTLFKGTINNIANLEESNESIVFTVKSKEKYEEKIGDFFFHKFNYYSLKWTQKSSSKKSDALIEANASWKTYFSSIFLESRDSVKMYGDQGKKIFQMLLGLGMTYPINRLTVEKNKFEYQKAQQISSSQTNTLNNVKKVELLTLRLNEINREIKEINERFSNKMTGNKIYEEFEVLLEEANKTAKNAYTTEREVQTAKSKLVDLQSQKDTNEAEVKRVEKEYEKVQKEIIDIKDYLEIGVFFSNLDVKQCPCCSKEISQPRKQDKSNEIKCSLCHSNITGNAEDIDKEIYERRIQELTSTGNRYEIEVNNLYGELSKIENEVNELNTKVDALERKQEKHNLSILNENIEKIQVDIANASRAGKSSTERKENLIAQRAIIEYRINELNKSNTIDTSILDNKIYLLESAINKLETLRYDSGKKILKKLESLILGEIREFGVTSITEVKITEKFDVKYKQDGEYIVFDDIAEGEQLRAKIAFYLSLIQMDIENKLGRHTRFLIIDSPGKEEADSKYLNGLSTVLKSIDLRFGNELQILIGTAERTLAGIVKNEVVAKKGKFLF